MGFRIGVLGPLNIDLIIKGSAPSNINELNSWSGPSDIQLRILSNWVMKSI
jgi:hypothetical protein